MIAYLRGKIKYIRPITKRSLGSRSGRALRQRSGRALRQRSGRALRQRSGRGSNFFIIDVNGVGYQVSATATVVNKLKIGQEVKVFTYLAVREDSQELFGFLSLEEVEFFKLLLEVPGIGPKYALNVLESANLSDIRKAVITDQPELLVKVAGLSKKIAEKIVLGLQDKVEKIGEGEKEETEIDTDLEALEALISLGYPAQLAREALAKVAKGTKETKDKIKEALRILGER